jgi:Ca-activated chloride channel family protein
MEAFSLLHSPGWLLLLPLLPLLAWRHHRRGARALLYSRLPAGSRGGWRLHLPFYARLLGLALLILAMSRPQLGLAWEESQAEGIDIEIVLDISGSMAAEDFRPRNRLTVAKEVVKDFIRRRPADRIGVIVFSGSALTLAPLTTDTITLEGLVDSVQLHTLRDGTAIGVALASAAARLKTSHAKSKVILLVTDGVNNAGAIDPYSAAAICAGLGVKVYTVGVGSAGRVLVPVQSQDSAGGQRRTRKVMMNVEVDEELLREVSRRTGGAFYHAVDSEHLRRIFVEIDQLETSPLQVRRLVRYREAFAPLVWSALAAMLLPLGLALLRLTAEP